MSKSDPVTALAGDEGVVLRLEVGGSISGRAIIAMSGEPLSAEITVASQDAERNEDGWWRMIGIRDDGRFQFGAFLKESTVSLPEPMGWRACWRECSFLPDSRQAKSSSS